MKNGYERKKYIITCVVIILVVICVTAVGIRWIYTGNHVMSTMLWAVIMEIVGFGAIAFAGYSMLDKAYEDMEQISKDMIIVSEDPNYNPEEKLCQGISGELYSNFSKMVDVLKESREKELSEKMFLRDIISDISHQLKTPLASLNIFIDLLLDDKVSEKEKQRQMLAESKNQLSRMEWMVLSLLKLARIEAGAIQFENKEWDMNVICAQAVDSVKALVNKREQTVTVTCSAHAKMSCDGDWLTEAIINLLKNASDYSGEKTAIELEVEENDLFTRIYVRDHGVGISEEDIPNIFKRFYRVHQEVNPNSVGIGLSLTKSIVEGMGGRITVKSKIGEGTSFEITFVRI